MTAIIALPSPATVAAYRSTRYRVVADGGPTVLVIGARDGRLERWLAGLGARSATIVTACNPFGQRTADATNATALAQLRRALSAADLMTLPSSNEDPSGRWPAEPGWCVFDASPRQVDRWLLEFRQHAAVRLAIGRRCRLVWHPALRARVSAGARTSAAACRCRPRQ